MPRSYAPNTNVLLGEDSQMTPARLHFLYLIRNRLVAPVTNDRRAPDTIFTAKGITFVFPDDHAIRVDKCADGSYNSEQSFELISKHGVFLCDGRLYLDGDIYPAPPPGIDVRTLPAFRDRIGGRQLHDATEQEARLFREVVRRGAELAEIQRWTAEMRRECRAVRARDEMVQHYRDIHAFPPRGDDIFFFREGARLLEIYLDLLLIQFGAEEEGLPFMRARDGESIAAAMTTVRCLWRMLEEFNRHLNDETAHLRSVPVRNREYVVGVWRRIHALRERLHRQYTRLTAGHGGGHEALVDPVLSWLMEQKDIRELGQLYERIMAELDDINRIMVECSVSDDVGLWMDASGRELALFGEIDRLEVQFNDLSHRIREGRGLEAQLQAL